MKILQIIPSLNQGGVERGTVEFALYLKQKGHTPIVISSGGTLTKILEEYKIQHIQWPVQKKNPFMIFALSFRLAAFIRKHKIEIVHARSRVPAWITYLARFLTSFRWITTCHGLYRPHFLSRVMVWSDKIIVATQAAK